MRGRRRRCRWSSSSLMTSTCARQSIRYRSMARHSRHRCRCFLFLHQYLGNTTGGRQRAARMALILDGMVQLLMVCQYRSPQFRYIHTTSSLQDRIVHTSTAAIRTVTRYRSPRSIRYSKYRHYHGLWILECCRRSRSWRPSQTGSTHRCRRCPSHHPTKSAMKTASTSTLPAVQIRRSRSLHGPHPHVHYRFLSIVSMLMLALISALFISCGRSAPVIRCHLCSVPLAALCMCSPSRALGSSASLAHAFAQWTRLGEAAPRPSAASTIIFAHPLSSH